MKARAYKQYNDPFDQEGRALIKVAKALVVNAQTETERAAAAQELKKVLEYVKRHHLRVNKDVHARQGSELLLSPVEGNKSLQ
jgi:hemerythrin